MTPFSRLRGPGRVLTAKLPQERMIWQGEIQPSPFVGRTRNKSQRVIIDDDSITVDGVDGTVIIDGSSNMFKILTTGTLSKSSNNGDDTVTSTVTLTALGTFTATPAHISHTAGGTGTTDLKSGSFFLSDASDFVATTSGGSPTAARAMGTFMGRVATQLNGSDQAVVEFRITNAAGGAQTTHARYYVLKEAAF